MYVLKKKMKKSNFLNTWIQTVHRKDSSDGFSLGKDESRGDQSDVMPTGRVVGVVQRNWRDYVASFAENEVNASSWTSMFSGPPWISPVSPNLISECAISRWKFSFTFGCRWLIKMLTFVWIVEIILVLVFTNLYRRTLRKTNDRVVYSLITIQHWTGEWGS